MKISSRLHKQKRHEEPIHFGSFASLFKLLFDQIEQPQESISNFSSGNDRNAGKNRVICIKFKLFKNLLYTRQIWGVTINKVSNINLKIRKGIIWSSECILHANQQEWELCLHFQFQKHQQLEFQPNPGSADCTIENVNF